MLSNLFNGWVLATVNFELSIYLLHWASAREREITAHSMAATCVSHERQQIQAKILDERPLNMDRQIPEGPS